MFVNLISFHIPYFLLSVSQAIDLLIPEFPLYLPNTLYNTIMVLVVHTFTGFMYTTMRRRKKILFWYIHLI